MKNIEREVVIRNLLPNEFLKNLVREENPKGFIYGEDPCLQEFLSWLLSEYEHKDALEKLGYEKTSSQFHVSNNETLTISNYELNDVIYFSTYKYSHKPNFMQSIAQITLTKELLKALNEVLNDLEKSNA